MNKQGLQTALPDDSGNDTNDRHYYIFLILYLLGLSMLGSFVNDMYTPAMPEMCNFFNVAASTVQLGLTMTLIGAAIGQFIMGPVSDHTGRRPVLWFSLSLAAVSAFLCIFSKNITIFLIFRFFQGVGASGGYFLARTIPADIYNGRALAKFMAIIGAVNGIAPASAPILGGFISETFSWKGIFITLAAFAVLLFIISPGYKESLPASRRTHGGFMHSIDNYKNLIVNRAFMTHVMLKGWTLALLFAYISAAPFILQTRYGLSESVYGLVVGGNAIFVAIGSIIALKFKPLKLAAYYGALGMGVFVTLQFFALWFINNMWIYEILTVLMLFCMGLVFSASNTLAMNEGRAQAGEASAVLGIVGYVLGGIASPLVGIGNVAHSTAIVMEVLTIFIIISAFRTRRIPADLGS